MTDAPEVEYLREQSHFNLCDEPWIPVLHREGHVIDVSLRTFFANADSYVRVVGELGTQETAINRMLLAVVHRALGNGLGVAAWKAAQSGWGTGANQAHSPTVVAVLDYLTAWHHKFWLFDPVHPFYQVPIASVGEVDMRARSGNDIWRLVPEIEEAKESRRILTSRRTAAGSQTISNAEAARWLLAAQSYDKSMRSGLSHEAQPGLRQYPKATTLARASAITVVGRTCRETVLLNLVLGRDLVKTGPTDLPPWEREPQSGHIESDLDFTDPQTVKDVGAEVVGTRALTGVVDALTWQSRRLSLIRDADADMVRSATRATGDIMFRPDSFENETMVAWRVSDANKKDGKYPWVPFAHTDTGAIWQDFASLISVNVEQERHEVARPKTVLWLEQLADHGLIPPEVTTMNLSVSTVHWDVNKSKYEGMTDALIPLPTTAFNHSGRAIDSRGLNIVASGVASAVSDLRRVAEAARKAVLEVYKVSGVEKPDAARRAADVERLVYAAAEREFAGLMSDFSATVASASSRRDLRNAYARHRASWHRALNHLVLNHTDAVFRRVHKSAFRERNGSSLGEREVWFKRELASILSERHAHRGVPADGTAA
jgi:CRISPR system Cascade subunit CasA